MDLSTAATASSSSSVTVSRLSVVPPQQRHVHVQQRQAALLQVSGVATNAAAATTTELKSRPVLVTPHAVVPPVAVSEHLSVRPPQYDGDMRPQVRRNAET